MADNSSKNDDAKAGGKKRSKWLDSLIERLDDQDDGGEVVEVDPEKPPEAEPPEVEPLPEEPPEVEALPDEAAVEEPPEVEALSALESDEPPEVEPLPEMASGEGVIPVTTGEIQIIPTGEQKMPAPPPLPVAKRSPRPMGLLMVSCAVRS